MLGVEIASIDSDDALAEIEALRDRPEPQLVAYANAHTLNLAHRDPAYRRVLSSAGIVLPDGSGVALGARLSGARIRENLNGSDFNPRILELAAGKGWPVYFVGARPGVAQRAAELLRARFPGLDIVGVRDGYFADSEGDKVAAEIREAGAEVVMAALGNPLQEMWLHGHLSAMQARLGVGVGAFFDFAAGAVPRAPRWMNRAGIEWVFRLAQEPRRLWRRYIVGNPTFLVRVATERWGKRKA
jgi:exopolysaccharide biosynthesis WecB/TagA/CpsF family protein